MNVKPIRKEFRVNQKHEFIVEFVLTPKGYYEIWFRLYPRDPLGNDSKTHHIFSSGQVCITPGKEPRTVEKAEFIACHLMETYSNYVLTGKFE